MELDMQFKTAGEVMDFIRQLQKIISDDMRICCRDRKGMTHHIRDLEFSEDTVILIIN